MIQAGLDEISPTHLPADPPEICHFELCQVKPNKDIGSGRVLVGGCDAGPDWPRRRARFLRSIPWPKPIWPDASLWGWLPIPPEPFL